MVVRAFIDELVGASGHFSLFVSQRVGFGFGFGCRVAVKSRFDSNTDVVSSVDVGSGCCACKVCTRKMQANGRRVECTGDEFGVRRRSNASRGMWNE